MSSRLFQESSAAFKRALAGQLGCGVEAFERQELTVVERPADSWEPHLGIVAECGVGSVVSVRDPALAEWTRQQELEAHFRVFLPSFLEGMAARARELGHAGARSHSPSVGMVLGDQVALPPLSGSFRVVHLTDPQVEELRATRDFENALAEPEEHDRIARFKRAIAIRGLGGEIAAVSGVWEQYPGIDEIGVDVHRNSRGQGLARYLTISSTTWVRQQGRWPIYTFGFSNLRSHNNGVSCGYRPLWALAVVYQPGAGG